MFLSFRRDHKMMKNTTCQTFLKKLPFRGRSHYHRPPMLRKERSKIDPIRQATKCHNFWVKGQCKKRWLMSSKLLLLQRTQEIFESWMIFIRESLAFVFIRPSNTNQTKISIRKGTKPFHCPLMISKLALLSILANLEENDLTEKVTVFEGVQTHLSVFDSPLIHQVTEAFLSSND